MKSFYSADEQFDPEAPRMTFPPVGDYTLCLTGALAMNKGSDGRMKEVMGEPQGIPDAASLSFEISEGEKSGMKFNMFYNIGHSNVVTAKMAREAIQSIYWAVTGVKVPPRTSCDITKAFFKPFRATLAHSAKNGVVQLDKNNNPYHELKAFKNIAAEQAAATGVTNAPVEPQTKVADWDK